MNAIFSAFGIKNSIPITISNIPNRIKKAAKLISIGKALLKSDCTNGLAGLSPITFRIPNQKNTTNKANLPKGMLNRLATLITISSTLFDTRWNIK